MKHACERISQLASERLERNLSLLESLRLRLHLLMCSACRHYSDHLNKLHLALHMKRTNPAVTLPQDKRKSIKKTLKDIAP